MFKSRRGSITVAGLLELRSEDELRQLTGIKWAKYGAEVLPAWVADMDMKPPRFAIDAARDLIERADVGYNFAAPARLPELFSSWQERHHGWTPDPSQVAAFTDVLHAIEVTLWLHTSPEASVVVFTPIYPPFLRALHGAKRELIDVPLDRPGWRLSAERLEQAIGDNTEAILLCNPHNPTGRMFDASERQAIAEVVVERGLVLISDEVWADITHPGAAHVPMATVNQQVAAQTITITSASKTFNLAGLRCAVAHIGDGLRSRFDELPEHFLGAVNSVGAEVTAACWERGDAWAQELRSFLTERRSQVLSRLETDLPIVGTHQPQATYLAWLDFTATNLGPDPASWLLENAKVALSHGPDFGVHGAGFARLNFATSPVLLDDILNRMVDALDY